MVSVSPFFDSLEIVICAIKRVLVLVLVVLVVGVGSGGGSGSFVEPMVVESLAGRT